MSLSPLCNLGNLDVLMSVRVAAKEYVEVIEKKQGMVFVKSYQKNLGESDWWPETRRWPLLSSMHDVAPPHGLFLTCRREKCIQYYTAYIQQTESCVRSLNAKIHYLGTWGGGHHCKVQTSLHFDPILQATAPFPTSHWPHPFPKSTPFSTQTPQIWHNFTMGRRHRLYI